MDFKGCWIDQKYRSVANGWTERQRSPWELNCVTHNYGTEEISILYSLSWYNPREAFWAASYMKSVHLVSVLGYLGVIIYLGTIEESINYQNSIFLVATAPVAFVICHLESVLLNGTLQCYHQHDLQISLYPSLDRMINALYSQAVSRTLQTKQSCYFGRS